MKRTAFTMLELVFVIIVIGILAALAMPNFNRNPLAEATEQLANHIRYTQHLAMVDDRFDSNDTLWHTQMWIFRIREVNDVNNGGESEWYYEVFSDKTNDNNSQANDEEAIDPMTGETLGNGSIDNTVDDNKTINLTRNYGITNITISGGNSSIVSATRSIAFDNLGRPYRNAVSNFLINPNENWRNFIMTSDMNITLTDSDNQQASIIVRPETGYVSVAY